MPISDEETLKMFQKIVEAPTPLTSVNAQPQPPALHDTRDRLDRQRSAQLEVSSRPTSRSFAAMLILNLILLTVFGSFSTGLLMIGLPTIVSDIDLDESLILWRKSWMIS